MSNRNNERTDKRREYERNHYKKNKNRIKQNKIRYLSKPGNRDKKYKTERKWFKNNKKWLKNWKEQRNQKIADYIDNILLSSKCKYCGESDIRCLEFHHRNPKKKKFKISEATGRGLSLKTIVKEIKKCDILCANCHKKRTPIKRKYRFKNIKIEYETT